MSKHIDKLLLSKKVLLLQGPMGDFFYRFAQWLNQKKITCYKINFNGGDRFFYKTHKNVFDYQERLGDFTAWLACFLIEHEIDAIVCFGDCRKYHQLAKIVAQKNNILFFAFEEGYIRPNYITFEQDGVNFFSNFLTHLEQSKTVDQHKIKIPEIYDVKNSYSKAVKSAIVYYFFSVLCRFQYPYYEHHRGISPLKELGCGIRSGYRRLKNKIWEKKAFKLFVQQYSKQYFTFALQVHNDSQIKTHSELKSVEKYIALVIENFSHYADASTHLLIKHHPMDRGYRDYRKLIAQYAKKFNVQGRIHYFCDIHLPTVLKHSLGLVTVNSTTGIQALFHHIPVKVMGHALYNLPKLTNQYALSKFWTNPGQVDAQYFAYFRKELISYSQLNGSFYGISPWTNAYNHSELTANQQTTHEKVKVI